MRNAKDVALVIITLLAIGFFCFGACLLDAAEIGPALKMMIPSGIWIFAFVAANWDRFCESSLNL